MPYFILGIALLAGFLLLMRWLTTVNPHALAWAVRIAGGALAVGVIALLIESERIQILLYALPFALPFYFQWRSRRLRRRNARGPRPGSTSEVDTGWLRMELDHDSGAMRGTVQRGRFAGRGLAGMTLEELRELHEEIGADPDSVRVLEAYLDRTHGPDWRTAADAAGARTDGAGTGSGGGQAGPVHGAAMTEEEAYEILDLAPGASADAIKEAHRRLMAKLHPDRGGSTYLAAKLNQAKDRLLKRG